MANSIYGEDAITISEVMNDPHWIPERIHAGLKGAFIEDLLFRNGGEINTSVLAYSEQEDYLFDKPSEVAEFAEIPATILGSPVKNVAYARKIALGVRISYEMKKEGRFDLLAQQINALGKTMIRASAEHTFNTLDKSSDIETNEVTASAEWDDDSAKPVKDLFDAIGQVQGGMSQAIDGAYMGNEPDTLVLHPTALSKLVQNEQIQRFYMGDVAHENPLYRGLKNFQICGLDVVTSRYFPADKAYVLERGSAGVYADTIPLTITDTYPERGDSVLGGATMSWRTDAVLKRAIAIDNPSAVARITGI